MKTRTALLILCQPALWLAAAPVGAAAAGAAVAVEAIDYRSAPGGAFTSSPRAKGIAVSMDQAVRMVEQRFHARVVKAETERENGRTVYVLRLLNESGKVWTVRVDAADGAVQ